MEKSTIIQVVQPQYFGLSPEQEKWGSLPMETLVSLACGDNLGFSRFPLNSCFGYQIGSKGNLPNGILMDCSQGKGAKSGVWLIFFIFLVGSGDDTVPGTQFFHVQEVLLQ